MSRKQQNNFSLHTWYKEIAQFTHFTEVFSLSFAEAKAITACYHHHPTDGYDLISLKKKLDAKMKHFPNGACLRFDTRAPKDLPVFAFQGARIRHLVDVELEKLDMTQVQDVNERGAAFLRATNRSLKVTTGEEALGLLVLSELVTQDLEKALALGETQFTAEIILREWVDEVADHPEMKFRGYVHKNQLNALTQFFSFIKFPTLIANKEQIEQRILTYFESVQGFIKHESYVIDFFVLKSKVLITDLNPFRDGGTGLFSWNDDNKIIMEGPYEFRITAPPIKHNPLAVLPPAWDEYMLEKSQTKIDTLSNKIMIPVMLLAAYGIWKLISILVRK